MLILGIESSCDETAVALVKSGRKVLSSQVASQVKDHQKFGGVVPEIAARKHLDHIWPLYKVCMAEAGVRTGDIDGIAVTQGPGLIGALLVGVHFAKGLSLGLGKPLIPVNHVHAHIDSVFLDSDKAPAYPALGCVISGGHTNLYYLESPLKVKLIGYTIDDACGECFDKTAKLLGLTYPGGAQIETLAQEGGLGRFSMPKMMATNDLRFSFSGLKTHIARVVAKNQLSAQETRDLCASFQEEALGQLVRKLKLALKSYPGCRSLLVSGGVAINQRLGELLNELDVETFKPKPRYCGDNAAMIAGFAHKLFTTSATKKESFDAFPRYPFIESQEGISYETA